MLTIPARGWPTEGIQPYSVRSPAPISLRQLVSIFFRNKALAVFLFLGIFSTVALVTALVPRRYEARMKLLVKNERAELVVSPGGGVSTGFQGEVDEKRINSEIELLNSADVLAEATRKSGLALPKNGGDASAAAVEEAARRLQKEIEIIPVRKSNVIQVTYRSSTPERASRVLTELSKAFLDAHLMVHKTPGAQEFYREQVDHYAQELKNAEKRLMDFKIRNGAGSLLERLELGLRKSTESDVELAQVGVQLAEAEARAAQLEKEVAAQENRIVTQSRALTNQFSVERLNTMLTELENQRTEALTKFRADDRRVTQLETQIANTRTARDRAVSSTAAEQSTDVNPIRQGLEKELAQTRFQIAGLRARRESLAAVAGANRSKVDQFEGFRLENDGLNRAVKEAETNYLLYLRRQEESRIAASLDRQKIANVVMLEAPVAASEAVTPNVILNLGLGFVLASLVTFGGLPLVELSRRSYHTPTELESGTGIRVLGSIPYQREHA